MVREMFYSVFTGDFEPIGLDRPGASETEAEATDNDHLSFLDPKGLATLYPLRNG